MEEPTTWAQLKEWTATANRTELRLACKELGISTSGTKADLRDRIMNVADVNDPNAPAAYQPSNPTLLSAQAEEDEEEVMENDPFVTSSALDRLLSASREGLVGKDEFESYKTQTQTNLEEVLKNSHEALLRQVEGPMNELGADIDALNARDDRLEADIAKLTQVGENNVRRIEQVNVRVDGVDGRVDEVDGRVSQIDSRWNSFFTGRLLTLVMGIIISFFVAWYAVEDGWFDDWYLTNTQIVIVATIFGTLIFHNFFGDLFGSRLSRSKTSSSGSQSVLGQHWNRGRFVKRDAK